MPRKSHRYILCYYNLLIQENCITLQEEESNSLNGNRNQKKCNNNEIISTLHMVKFEIHRSSRTEINK